MIREQIDDVEDGILGDISRLKQAELDLKECQEKIRTIAKSVGTEYYQRSNPAQVIEAIQDQLLDKRLELAIHRGE